MFIGFWSRCFKVVLARFTFCPLFGNYGNLPEARELTDDTKQIFFEEYRGTYNKK
jgi:hypothetical protein